MAKEFLELDGPDVICHYVYGSNLGTANAFIKQLNNSGEDILLSLLTANSMIRLL